MRALRVVLPVIFAAICVSTACGRTSSDVAATAPSAVTNPADAQNAANSCDQTKVQWVIGQPAGADLLERARVGAGARSARFLRPHDIVTMEFLGSRFNILLDAGDIVRTTYCG